MSALAISLLVTAGLAMSAATPVSAASSLNHNTVIGAAFVSAQSALTAAGGCEYISNYQASVVANITGGGVNKPVTLTNSGNCFTPKYPFTHDGFKGYEYQNGAGHCLWQDGDLIKLGGACQDSHANEEFYGSHYDKPQGWFVQNVATAENVMEGIGGPNGNCNIGSEVNMGADNGCANWNFPSSK